MWVGYQSATQFSREYKRLFGLSPLQDMRTFHAGGGTDKPIPQPAIF
ncbi:hypothetical protein [Paenibacillus yonginensis]